jgi:hypothetical protein
MGVDFHPAPPSGLRPKENPISERQNLHLRGARPRLIGSAILIASEATCARLHASGCKEARSITRRPRNTLEQAIILGISQSLLATLSRTFRIEANVLRTRRFSTDMREFSTGDLGNFRGLGGHPKTGRQTKPQVSPRWSVVRRAKCAWGAVSIGRSWASSGRGLKG